MGEEKNIIISCKNLSKTYENGLVCTKVLKNINLEFTSGSINLIYGKSGSGKTTLLNLLAGLDSATNGTIYFKGVDYKNLSESNLSKLRGNNFGFVFQAYHLINRISVEDNILCPGYINGKNIDMMHYNFLLECLGIKALRSKQSYQLSGGEQQRVAIARAMILKPQIVFADEPTGNLDTANTKTVTDVFQQLNKRYGTTFIIVTHEENLISTSNQTIRIKDGEIISE